MMTDSEPSLPKPLQVFPNVYYTDQRAKRQNFDLYSPRDPEGPSPIILWIHGGAWQKGDKGVLNDKIQYVEAGFSLARLNYRYATEAPYPAQLDDVKAALLLICEEAEYFNIDTNNIFLGGHSAGAHLAACLGHAMADTQFPVSAIAFNAGPVEFFSLSEYRRARDKENGGALEILLGHTVDADPESAKRASPYHLITDRSPAHFIAFGAEDVVVPPQQGEIYAEALGKAGVDASLTIYEGAGHVSPCFSDPSHNEAIIQFFTKHLS